MKKKIIIVEGNSDKHHLKKIIHDDIDIICTYGTFGIEKFDAMLDKYDLDHREVYIFTDADDSGQRLRNKLQRELPHARHLYIPTEWTEVETTPEKIIAIELVKHHFDVKPIYLLQKTGGYMQVITGGDLASKQDAFVFIHSRFCGTCHVARGFLQKIESTHNRDIFYDLNGSLAPDLLQKYKIESVPCLLIIKDNIVKEKIYTFYSVANIYRYLLIYKPQLFD